jgi:virginiamycin A acetyltransferase
VVGRLLRDYSAAARRDCAVALGSGDIETTHAVSKRRHRWLLSIGAAVTLPAPKGQPEMPYLASISRGTVGAGDVRFTGLNRVGRRVEFQSPVTLGFATTLNKGCWLHGPVSLGNYCQLGPNVGLLGVNHDHQRLTPYNNRILFSGALKDSAEPSPILLGHGVWCGFGATVLKGVRIGNGAVVGAGSVVTRDIPAYQIAVGNPARVIRARFDDATCEAIEASRWWLRTPDELDRYQDLFSMDLTDDGEPALEALRQLNEEKPLD